MPTKTRMTNELEYRCLICAVVWLTFRCPTTAGEQIEGFTEPYQTIRVASPESGIVTSLIVKEGDVVTAGQPLAKLDDEVYQALLAIAKQQAQSLGRINAVVAELSMHTRKLDKLLELKRNGQANQEELERARAEVEVSEARLLAEREQNLLARLELQKVKVQLDRRTVTAPVSGIIVSLEKRQGEFISPTSPELLTLVQLDPLRATFLLTRPQALRLESEQEMKLVIPGTPAAVKGVVEFVSPVTDAESGTVAVKLRIDNPYGKLHSGERCFLELN